MEKSTSITDKVLYAYNALSDAHVAVKAVIDALPDDRKEVFARLANYDYWREKIIDEVLLLYKESLSIDFPINGNNQSDDILK